jgi:hypothetical protein
MMLLDLSLLTAKEKVKSCSANINEDQRESNEPDYDEGQESDKQGQEKQE